jgi:hypothetical protein
VPGYGLWRPPRPHGGQQRDRAGRHLAGHITWSALREFVAIFTLVWIAWLNGTLYHDLHGRAS